MFRKKQNCQVWALGFCTWEAEGGFLSSGQPGLHIETLFQNDNKSKIIYWPVLGKVNFSLSCSFYLFSSMSGDSWLAIQLRNNHH
jgi:hypothetical protein